MFYFPLISSSCEIDKYEGRVKQGLVEVMKDLEHLVHWEDTYNKESALIQGKNKKAPSE